jgi:uncharacterized protein (TIGR04255 family)
MPVSPPLNCEDPRLATPAAATMTRAPKKLTHDAILEAVFELRFHNKELPEVTVGRLVDNELWRHFPKARTPFSDIPTTVRLADPNLRFQALVELREPSGRRLVKIGTNVISFHNLKPYMGWDTGFADEIRSMTTFVFERTTDIRVSRMGLRYINALTPTEHRITRIADLNFTLRVGGADIQDDLNVNYRITEGNFVTLRRIATPSFVQGNLPDDTAAYVDIDVFNRDGTVYASKEDVLRWTDEARNKKNVAFFELFTDAQIDGLVEEWG